MDWQQLPIKLGLILTVTLVTSIRAGAIAAPPRGAASQVVIALRPACRVERDDVLISDIARVETNDPALKLEIEGLDVSQAPSGGAPAVVTAKFVEFRLRLAGIDVRRVAIRGSKTEVTGFGAEIAAGAVSVETSNRAVVQSIAQSIRASNVLSPAHAVRASKPAAPDAGSHHARAQSPEEAIVAAAKKAILNQLPWGEEDITFQLAQSIAHDLNANGGFEDAACDAHVRSTGGPPLGRVNVDVTVTSGARSPVVVPVSLDVRHYDNVVATAHPIARGRKLQKEDLYLHRCDVTTSADYCTTLEQMVGRVACRPLTALQTIREQDLERDASGVSGPNQPFLVKRQDRVAMVAKVGDLSISVRGEALQDGRLGQTIRVQNVESKSIVQGRVLSADEVEITY